MVNDIFEPAKVAFGIVVYNEVFYKTPAFLSLVESLDNISIKQVSIYIYDNSDQADWTISLKTAPDKHNVQYFHNVQNPGISVAYNYLANRASEAGQDWIVFMDQDTIVPVNFAEVYLKSVTMTPDVFVKVPVLFVKGQILSPLKLCLKKAYPVKVQPPGIFSLHKLAFINSGMMINIPFFKSVGGYNEKIKLDFADFQFIERARKKVNEFEVLPVKCTHDFSHNESDEIKSLSRYKIFINDIARCDRNSLIDSIGYVLVDWSHLIKLSIKFRSLSFWRTRKEIKERLIP